jgi:hypothetical protein
MLNMKAINYVAIVLGGAFLLGQPALAQPSLEGTIDSSIRNNSIPGASKESNAVIVSLKKWMGPYKKLEVLISRRVLCQFKLALKVLLLVVLKQPYL